MGSAEKGRKIQNEILHEKCYMRLLKEISLKKPLQLYQAN